MDVEVLEDGLVEFTAADVVGLLVVLLGAGEQAQAVVQRSSDHLLVEIKLVQLAFDTCSLSGDAGLFLLQLVGVDGVGVVGVEHLLTIPVKLRQLGGVRLPARCGGGQDGAHVGKYQFTDLFDVLWSQRDRCPVLGDQVFELVGLDGPEGAAVLEPLSAEAEEVVVGGAGAVAGLAEAQRFSAFATKHRALEIVAADAGLLTALVPA